MSIVFKDLFPPDWEFLFNSFNNFFTCCNRGFPVAGRCENKKADFSGFYSTQAMMDMHAGYGVRSEEHTSELQSLMRISYAVFCLKKKKNTSNTIHTTILTLTYRTIIRE